jgi:DNA-directed RNA polymerase subunit RPC12/RpoP
MDYRCPVCRADLGRRKLSHTIVARIAIDCPHCASTLRVNIHPLELAVVLVAFASILALAALAYWYRSQRLVLAVLALAFAAGAASNLLERTYLRSWPRYVRN